MEVRSSACNRWETPCDKRLVFIVKELLAAAEDVNRVGLQVHIQAELHVSVCAGFLSHHLINCVYKVNCASKALALRIGQLSI